MGVCGIVAETQKTEQGERALFYWKQAYNFYNASECLSMESRPVTAYYCCLNAIKALLNWFCKR